jgi:hypothetical protein
MISFLTRTQLRQRAICAVGPQNLGRCKKGMQCDYTDRAYNGVKIPQAWLETTGTMSRGRRWIPSIWFLTTASGLFSSQSLRVATEILGNLRREDDDLTCDGNRTADAAQGFNAQRYACNGRYIAVEWGQNWGPLLHRVSSSGPPNVVRVRIRLIQAWMAQVTTSV